MAEFKWIKGDKPKETGEYLVSIKEAEGLFLTGTDIYDEYYNEWEAYNDYEIVAYAPYPKPYKTRNRNGKSNNRKTNKKTK